MRVAAILLGRFSDASAGMLGCARRPHWLRRSTKLFARAGQRGFAANRRCAWSARKARAPACAVRTAGATHRCLRKFTGRTDLVNARLNLAGIKRFHAIVPVLEDAEEELVVRAWCVGVVSAQDAAITLLDCVLPVPEAVRSWVATASPARASPRSWMPSCRSRRTWGLTGVSRIWYLKQFDAYCAEHDRTVFNKDTVEGWVGVQLQRCRRYRSWMSYIRDVGRWMTMNGIPGAYVLSDRWKAPVVVAHP